jgi:hypothetical protein
MSISIESAYILVHVHSGSCLELTRQIDGIKECSTDSADSEETRNQKKKRKWGAYVQKEGKRRIKSRS